MGAVPSAPAPLFLDFHPIESRRSQCRRKKLDLLSWLPTNRTPNYGRLEYVAQSGRPEGCPSGLPEPAGKDSPCRASCALSILGGQ